MKSSYKVLRLAADYPVGGKPTYGLQPNLYYLSKEQARQGHTVKVISRSHTGQPAHEQVGDVEVYRVGNPFNVNALLMVRRLYKKETDFGSTLIHTHSTSGLFAGALRQPLELPVFSHIHGASRSCRMPQRLVGVMDEEFSESRMWYYYFRERLFWSSADCLLSVSNALKNDLINYYDIPESKISVVYNGVDADLFRRTQSPLPDAIKHYEGKKIILYVGHFGPRKGIVFLIRAMQQVVKEVPDAVAVCIGGVPSWLGKKEYWAYLQGEVRQHNLEGKVLLLEKVPNDQLPTFYSHASVFALPSFYEAFAKVVLEAMSCEAPIVITREGGPQEAVEDGKTGYLVNFGSTEELASELVRVLQDERRAREMGREARRRVEKDFTWEAVGQRIDLAYDSVFRKADQK